MKDLTNSNIDRQNILNNRYALSQIQEYVGLPGMLFENEYRFTKEMVARFFEIDDRTIQRYLEQFEEELKHNGYILIKGKALKEFKLQFGHVNNIRIRDNGFSSIHKPDWQESIPTRGTIAPHFLGNDIPAYGKDNLWFL
jgi:hypothetical protein